MGFSRQEYWSGVPLPSPRLPLGFIILFYLIEVYSWLSNNTTLSCVSPLTCRFFPTVNITILHGPWLVESVEAELWMWRAAVNYTRISTAWRVTPLTSTLCRSTALCRSTVIDISLHYSCFSHFVPVFNLPHNIEYIKIMSKEHIPWFFLSSLYPLVQSDLPGCWDHILFILYPNA